MADAELADLIGAMARHVELELRPVGGRIFVDNATLEHIDSSKIELKCFWSGGLASLFSLSIVIGDQKHMMPLIDEDAEDENVERHEEIGWRLGDCPIMLTLHPIDAKWLTESADRNDGKPILGQLYYHPPVNTDDGVVNEKRPTVTAWVGLGRDNFNVIRDSLVTKDAPQFQVGLSLDFPPEAIEQGDFRRKIRWDGKGALPVTGAVVVWKNNDWSADFDTQMHERKMLSRRHNIEPPEPRLEHQQTLDALSRVESAMAKLSTPIWIAAAAAIASLILR